MKGWKVWQNFKKKRHTFKDRPLIYRELISYFLTILQIINRRWYTDITRKCNAFLLNYGIGENH